MIDVRPFQEDVKKRTRIAVSQGKRKVLIQAPTGAGKTVIASGIIRSAEEKGRSTLFFAHRRELIYQCADKLAMFGVRHGIVMSGEERDVYATTQVASIDTFRARVMQRQVMDWPKADLVVIDEAHRSLSPTYMEVIKHYEEEGSVILGLTATPMRSDGRGLGHIYNEMVSAPSIAELIKLGYLVKPKHFAPSIPDLTGVRTTAGDYNPADLERALNKKELVGDIVTNWMRFASTKKTIVFASGVDHSIALRKEFMSHGIRAGHLDALTPDHERQQIIEDFKTGKIMVLCNCMVLTEGFDEPTVSCVVLARPTKNKGLYVQMGGRGLRTSEGKEDCYILDHSGNVYRHGKLDDHMHWSLDTRKLKAADSKADAKKRESSQITCPACSCVYSGQVRCPVCGNVPQRVGNMVVNRDGTLVEIDATNGGKSAPKFTMPEMMSWLEMFEGRRARTSHLTPKWRNERFNEKFGFFPTREMVEGIKPAARETKEFAAWMRYLQIRWSKRNELKKSVSA